MKGVKERMACFTKHIHSFSSHPAMINKGPNRNADIMGQFAHLAAGEDLSTGDKMKPITKVLAG